MNETTVRALWGHFASRYNTRVVPKALSPFMRFCGWGLELLGILNAREFREHFTTVIGRTIYVPFTVGVPIAGYSGWSQALVCVHEHQHVIQMERDGRVRFSLRYLLLRRARAAYEVEAYSCDVALALWRGEAAPTPERIVGRLRSYGLREDDLADAHAALTTAIASIALGHGLPRAAEEAIGWLDSIQ